jgi:hypothetical protein
MNVISMHTDGQVVIHLGGWRITPFDAPSRRHQIRRLLNSIPGVEIAGREVYGWPRFQIGALDDPANLDKLVGILDQIATETTTARQLATA